MARLCVNGFSRTTAAAPCGSQDTDMLARLRFPLHASHRHGKSPRPQGSRLSYQLDQDFQSGPVSHSIFR